MSKVTTTPAVEETRTVRTKAPSVVIELTPSEAYHLNCLLSCCVLVSSLRRLGLERLQTQLAQQFFTSFGQLSPLDLGKWRPAEVGMGDQRPLDLHACMTFARTIAEREKCDA